MLPALLLLVTACATKGYVRETVDKKGTELTQRVDQVDQKVDAVDGKVAQESQRINGVGSRVSTMETTLTETSEAARNAKEASLAAQAKADGVDQRVTRLWSNRFNPKPVESVEILFGFNKADLDDRAQTSLSNLSKDMQGNPNLTVQLVGYTDMRGSREYNYQLSQRRVDAVRRYLIERGVQMSRIQGIGLGPMVDSGAPEVRKRRVTAQLMLEQD
jgi:outer membrane protein OmpA-like peptidoglycan-associated protein